MDAEELLKELSSSDELKELVSSLLESSSLLDSSSDDDSSETSSSLSADKDLFLLIFLLLSETDFESSLLIMLTVSGDLEDLFGKDMIELFFLHSLLEN